MQETSKQHRAYRNLLLRHADKPTSMLAEAARTGTGPTPLKLPFILIQVNPEAAVEIQISDDNRQALFDFARCLTLSQLTTLYLIRRMAILSLAAVIRTARGRLRMWAGQHPHSVVMLSTC